MELKNRFALLTDKDGDAEALIQEILEKHKGRKKKSKKKIVSGGDDKVWKVVKKKVGVFCFHRKDEGAWKFDGKLEKKGEVFSFYGSNGIEVWKFDGKKLEKKGEVIFSYSSKYENDHMWWSSVLSLLSYEEFMKDEEFWRLYCSIAGIDDEVLQTHFQLLEDRVNDNDDDDHTQKPFLPKN